MQHREGGGKWHGGAGRAGYYYVHYFVTKTPSSYIETPDQPTNRRQSFRHTMGGHVCPSGGGKGALLSDLYSFEFHGELAQRLSIERMSFRTLHIF